MKTANALIFQAALLSEVAQNNPSVQAHANALEAYKLAIKAELHSFDLLIQGADYHAEQLPDAGKLAYREFLQACDHINPF